MKVSPDSVFYAFLNISLFFFNYLDYRFLHSIKKGGVTIK